MALQKPSGGGVRPIAVGCTLRRLVAKISGQKVVDEMAELLRHRLIGYRVSGGAKAAVHACSQSLPARPPKWSRPTEIGLQECIQLHPS